jgi:hypothetical protein
LVAAMISSPGCISGNSARICAACPDDVAVPPRPPSSAATRSSSTATVGLVSRE